MGDMDQEYQLEYFRANGFARRICTSCGSPFWTQGDSQVCGDTPCVEYGFIGRPLMDRRYDLREMREAFLIECAQRPTLCTRCEGVGQVRQIDAVLRRCE